MFDMNCIKFFVLMDHYVCVSTGYDCSFNRLQKKGLSKIVSLIEEGTLVYACSFMRKDREHDLKLILNAFGGYSDDDIKKYKRCFKNSSSTSSIASSNGSSKLSIVSSKTCNCDDENDCYVNGCERHCMCSFENHCELEKCKEHDSLPFVNKYYIGEFTNYKDECRPITMFDGISYNGPPVFILKDGMTIHDVVKDCRDINYCHIWYDYYTDMKIVEFIFDGNGRSIKFTLLKVEAESG